MQKLVWKNSIGDEINLTSGNYGITEWEGFSNTSLNIQSQQVPFQDGGVFLDALMEQRELSVTLAMNDKGNLETRYRLRRELIHALNPKLGEGYLIYTNDFISKRIKCVAQIPLFETHNSNDSGTPKASLAWTACEPYWEDLEETSITFDITEQPIIENKGDIPAQLKITFNSHNVVNPCLFKTNDNTKIQFNGNLTDSLSINTNVGKKSATTNSFNFVLDSFSNYNIFVYAKNKDLFVFIGQNTIITTKDLVNFSMKKSIINFQQDICYSESLGIFVIVSYGTIITSTDGLNWIDRGSIDSFNNVEYNTHLQVFIALGDNGHFAKSSDGITWTTQTIISTDKTFVMSANNENITVIVGTRQLLLTSSDGVNWTDRSAIVPADVTLYSIKYIDEISRFVACGDNGCIMTSTNGTDWENFTFNQSVEFHSIFFNKNTNNVVCVDFFGSCIAESANGTDWGVINTNNYSYYESEFIEKYAYVLSIGQGKMAISTNDYTFTPINNSGIQNDLKDVAFSDDNVFCFASSGGVYRTEDLTNYEYVYVDNLMFYSIIYIKPLSKFVMVGVRKIVQSQNGKIWDTVSIPVSTKTFQSIAYSDKLNLIVVVGESGTILSGTLNALVQVTSGTSSRINRVIYVEKKNRFIACCNDGTVLISSDGINWNNYQTGVTNLRSIIFVDYQNLFYAVGNNAFITSYDGMNWSENKTINSNYYNLLDIQFIKALGAFTLIGNNNVWKSKNGIDWELLDFNAVLNVTKEIAFNNKSALILGDDGILFSNAITDVNNAIDKISSDSDMNMDLSVGENNFRLLQTSGSFVCNLKYRQKYIGV